MELLYVYGICLLVLCLVALVTTKKFQGIVYIKYYSPETDKNISNKV